MLTLALTMALLTPLNSDVVNPPAVNQIQQLRASEIAERLAQTEAKRIQLELQIAKAKHAISSINQTAKPPSEVAEELSGYELLGIVTVGDQSDILLRRDEQIIRLQNGVAGPMQLTANIEASWVRLQRFGRFRDLPIVQGW